MSRTQNPESESWVRDAVASFEGPLTLYAARLLHDADRARDVVQETFLKLCSSDQASIDGHLAEWLFTVCRNRALDVLRKENRMTQLRDEQVLRCLSPNPGPLDVAERRELSAGLSSSWSHCPPISARSSGSNSKMGSRTKKSAASAGTPSPMSAT